MSEAIRAREPSRAEALSRQAFDLLASEGTARAGLEAEYRRARARCQQDGACASYGDAPNRVVVALDRQLELRSSGLYEQAVREAEHTRAALRAGRHSDASIAALDETVGRMLLEALGDAERALTWLTRARDALRAAASARGPTSMPITGRPELDAPLTARLASVLRGYALALLSTNLGATGEAARLAADEARTLLDARQTEGSAEPDPAALDEQAWLEERLGRCVIALELWTRAAARAGDAAPSRERTRALLGHARTQSACSDVPVCEAPGLIESYERASEAHEQLLARDGGESQASSTAGLAELRVFDLLTLAVACPRSAALRELALRAVLARKGTLLTLARAPSSFDPRAELALRGELRDTYRELARHGLPAIESARPPDPMLFEHLRQASALERARNLLAPEAAVSSRGVPDLLREQLSDAEALLEYVRYEPQPITPATRATRAPALARYALFMLSRTRETTLLDLGPAAPIDALVGRMLAAIEAPSVRATRGLRLPGARVVRAEDPARALHRKLVAPVLALLAGERHLHVAADGALWLVPFIALRDGRGALLDAGYTFTHHVTSRELLLRPRPDPAADLLVVAAPRYGPPAATLLRAFTPLAHADGEARELADRFRTTRGAELWLDELATKDALFARASPGVLHLASHAWVLPSTVSAASTSRATRAGFASPLPSMLRAGVALRDANLPGTSGHLTALEASTLDLHGTQLVVLSACSTARGEIDLREGVQGLVRAFLTAGAETVVSSLWPVDDATTRAFMLKYYDRLLAGEDRIAALHGAMRALRSTPATREPFFWAPFVGFGAAGALRR